MIASGQKKNVHNNQGTGKEAKVDNKILNSSNLTICSVPSLAVCRCRVITVVGTYTRKHSIIQLFIWREPRSGPRAESATTRWIQPLLHLYHCIRDLHPSPTFLITSKLFYDSFERIQIQNENFHPQCRVLCQS